MKLLCAILLLGTVGSAFALALFVKLTPAHPDPRVLIHSELEKWCENRRVFIVVLLPQKENDLEPACWNGTLELKEGTNFLASCNVDGIMLSDTPIKGWRGAMESHVYNLMTNRFSRPLRGAKLFRFEVATNLLNYSGFALSDRDSPDYTLSFDLKDFSHEP